MCFITVFARVCQLEHKVRVCFRVLERQFELGSAPAPVRVRVRVPSALRKRGRASLYKCARAFVHASSTGVEIHECLAGIRV